MAHLENALEVELYKIFIFVFCFVMLNLFSETSMAGGRKFNKVVYVVFENTNYEKAVIQPNFAALISKGALFTNFTAEVHPSQGNYIAMIAGSTLGVLDDRNYDLNDSHLGDLFDSKKISWKVYAEDFPGNCFPGRGLGLYARKHVPFLSFLNVTKNPARCKDIVDTKNFIQEALSGALPQFSMYIPNLKSDGHDSGVDYAGRWMDKTFSTIFNNAQIMSDTLFILTFDESSNNKNNQIYTLLLGAAVLPGVKNNQPLKHSSLLKLIEDEFQVGNLGRDDNTAPEIVGVWK